MTTDPLKTLGLPAGATESEIRSRYLKLVKQFPPEQSPERFREVHAAYKAAKDPLVIARQLLEPPSQLLPEFSDAIDEQVKNPPALTVALLLSLGNRSHKRTPNANNTTTAP